MIIGYGDLAGAIQDREGAIFFASGVSNSHCIDESQYQREKDLLKVFYNSYLSLFYFSSIYPTISRYSRHKLEMEELVRQNFKNYNIIRLGNITWGNNPHTFINYLRKAISEGREVLIKDEWKYLISKEQLLLMTNNLPLTGRNEISVFGEMKKVKDCL